MKNKNNLFKPASSKNRIWNLIKTLLQSTVLWLVFLYIIPSGIIKLEQAYQITGFKAIQSLGWGLFSVFSAIGIYSGYTMSWIGKGTPLPLDCPNELVIAGPYRYVRNPLALAGIGQGISVGIILGSYLVVLYAISGAFLWHFLVKPIEEKDLVERFGKPYLDYSENVNCWIPRLNN